MAAPSTMLPLGTEAPSFQLPGTDRRTWSLEDFADAPALLVIFLCNHCPYVQHVQEELAELTRQYMERGVAVVGIMPNDVDEFPTDDLDHMRRQKEEVGFPFPYLYDETQEVARAYRAACTPDFFLFDADRRLAYRGQMDDSRPGGDVPVTGKDLRAALDAVLAGEAIPEEEQEPSVGCSIKWKPGNEPVSIG